MGWHTIETFDEMNDAVEKVKQRWMDIAEDVGLIPERCVRVVEDNGEIRLEVTDDIHDYLAEREE